MKAFVSLMVLGLCSALAQANTISGLYQGKVGDLPIVVKISTRDNVLEGQYFYTSRGVNIELQGKIQGSTFRLQEEQTDSKTFERIPRATFVGSWTASTLKGTWNTADGKRKLPFTLNRVGSIKSVLPFAVVGDITPSRDGYTFLKFNHPFKLGKTFTLNDVSYRLDQEPLSGIQYPRVLKINNSTNSLLQAKHLELASVKQDCLSQLQDSGFAKDTEAFDPEVKVSYVSKNLISIVTEGMAFCGGAHPNIFLDVQNINVRSGTAFKISDLFNLPESSSGTTPETWVQLALQQKRKNLIMDAETLEECVALYNEQETIFSTVYSFAAKGLNVHFSFPHVAAACNDVVTIPYAQLKPHIKLSSPLNDFIH